MVRVYLGLGSNIGNRWVNLARGVNEIKKLVTVNRLSKVIESKPLYDLNQPNFLNMVIEADTTLSPHGLLGQLKSLEKKLGRIDSRRFGPRCIDIDILYYGHQIILEKDLIIPHPRISERPFVLGPLCELASNFIDPVLLKPVSYLYSSLVDANSSLVNTLNGTYF